MMSLVLLVCLEGVAISFSLSRTCIILLMFHVRHKELSDYVEYILPDELNNYYKGIRKAIFGIFEKGLSWNRLEGTLKAKSFT